MAKLYVTKKRVVYNKDDCNNCGQLVVSWKWPLNRACIAIHLRINQSFVLQILPKLIQKVGYFLITTLCASSNSIMLPDMSRLLAFLDCKNKNQKNEKNPFIKVSQNVWQTKLSKSTKLSNSVRKRKKLLEWILLAVREDIRHIICSKWVHQGLKKKDIVLLTLASSK